MLHKTHKLRFWISASMGTIRAAAGNPGFRRFAAIAIVAAWPATQGHAQEDVYPAARVKAAFLYHFATYVRWPAYGQADETDAASGEDTSPSEEPGQSRAPGEPGRANDEFTIAVIGADEVAKELEQFLPGHAIEGRPMNVRQLPGAAALTDEELVFIGSGASELNEQLARVAGRPILVVTDVPQGLRPGAMINFRVVDSHVRFEISQLAAESAGLELSSRLLAAAMFVDTAGAIVEIPAPAVAASQYTAP